MKKLFKRILALLVLAVFLLSVYLGIEFVLPGYNAYKEAVGEKPITEMVEEIRSREDYTKLNEVPKIYKDAVVAVEDHNFYSHGAVSFVSTFRAIFVNLKSKELKEGGSTITQQVAKNLYFELDKTIERKVAEIFLAIELEKLYTKDEILEIYINSIYYGSGYYCIYDAAKGYYGVEPIDLTDYQATILAGVPNAPSVYSPDNNTELTYQRQRQVIDAMVKYKFIDKNKAEEILKQGNEQ